MGLINLFKRSSPAQAPPPAIRLPKPDHALRPLTPVPEDILSAPRPAAKRPAAVPKAIVWNGLERVAPLSYQPRQQGHLHYTAKPSDSWDMVDLFDYWLDLVDLVPAELTLVPSAEAFERPRMDVEFEGVWAALIEKRQWRPADLALIMRWAMAGGELRREFDRKGMGSFEAILASFEERVVAREGEPVRAFKDPDGECAHAIVQLQFSNLDRVALLLARTFGIPAIVASLRGINAKLGPAFVKHACQQGTIDRVVVEEAAMMRAVHGEIVPNCPPDSFFLER